MRWELRRIEMLKPVERAWEPASDINPRILMLKDVAYRLSAALLDRAGRDCSQDHAAPFAQRLSSANQNLSLHLGFRDFAANVLPAPPQRYRNRVGRLRDLGWMPFDTGENEDAITLYFHAVSIDGVIDLTSLGPSSLAM
ncbi:MAG: hypothetical protein E7773_13590 [Sphingomonas sp.]|uniref:hypothetical protein n=1 Tax=Sphingomonas sp. TaxID=28214 RepID=UPI00121FFCD6|nr:hypothetical protein [Sphingomonas sp.]THD34698.1 MAG: hypothetical protein E7773_13590 [Sphingomonas sp.]